MVEAFESGVVDLSDFYFTGDDQRYRFETQTKRRFLDLLKERFNAGAKHGGHVMKWDTVIEQKTIELGRFFCFFFRLLRCIRAYPAIQAAYLVKVARFFLGNFSLRREIGGQQKSLCNRMARYATAGNCMKQLCKKNGK